MMQTIKEFQRTSYHVRHNSNMLKHSEVMFTNVISNFQPIFRGTSGWSFSGRVSPGSYTSFRRIAILCRTAQAPTSYETLMGSIRISECMRWNLLLKIPNDCSIFTLVCLKPH